MQINRDKRIGRVIFIVEGSSTEFVLLRRVFCNVLDYKYIEKRRNRPEYFINRSDSNSQIAVINTRESNIKDITEDTDYLDELFQTLREVYKFPIDKAAVYYLFDRDPKSNNNIKLIEDYITNLANPYDNENEYRPGQLLLSYPSIEGYIISNFRDINNDCRSELGSELKYYIGKNKDIQMNKISEASIIKAALEFIKFLSDNNYLWDLDAFSDTSMDIFTSQEYDYRNKRGFRLFSMLTLALMQLGIITTE